MSLIAITEHCVAVCVLLDELLAGELRGSRVDCRRAETLTSDCAGELSAGERLTARVTTELLVLHNLRRAALERPTLLLSEGMGMTTPSLHERP